MRVSKTGLETAIFGKTADVAILKEALSNAALSDEEEFDWTLLFLIVIFAINFFCNSFNKNASIESVRSYYSILSIIMESNYLTYLLGASKLMANA